MKIKTPVLINAAQQARENPGTFHRETDAELQAVKVGDFVKVCDGGERFWVIVTKAEYPMFQGEVSSHLLFNPSLKFGNVITFHADNIFITGPATGV
jgi:hypothetical protein